MSIQILVCYKDVKLSEETKNSMPEILNETITSPICNRVFLLHEETCTTVNCNYENPYFKKELAKSKKKEEGIDL